jgi:hypothetical protein
VSHFISFHFEASLEAANSHSTHLHHQLAQMSAEASRLHQLLYHNQQCLEGLQQEKEASICRLEAAQMAAEEEHKKHVNVCINMTTLKPVHIEYVSAKCMYSIHLNTSTVSKYVNTIFKVK